MNPPQTNTRNPHVDPRHPRAHGMYRDTATLALLRWITHLEQFSQITNQTKEDA